jgi:hypothetical protein
MRRFCSNLLLALLAIVNSPAESVSLVAGDEVFLFGGRTEPTPLTVRNEGTENQTLSLEWQLFQSTSATIAPIGERTSLGQQEFPAGQDAIVRIPVEPPEVRAITKFVVKVWAGRNELGQVGVTVCPTNLFSQLKGLGIEVQEPAELVARLLKGTENQADKRLNIVRVPTRDTDWNRDELAPAVLYIIGLGVQGAERLMPLKISNEEGRRVGILQDWFVPDLEKSALSQLRLLRSIDLLINPDQVRSPRNSK